MAKLFLIDGSNHAFRVQFALPPMTNSAGFPTRALYGFATLFAKLMREHRPEYVAVCFDTKHNFRHDLYPDYKGHRPEMPEDLRAQWPHFKELVEGFGAVFLAVDNYEADDVIGTLATRNRDDVDVYLVTGDKDFCQLVDDKVHILDLMKDAELGPDEVVKKMGVPPAQIIDLLGLVGDKSDNIPGVPGVGPKKAAQFLARFGSLEGVLAHADEIGGKTGQRVAEHAENARLSYVLATIVRDVPIPHTLEDLRLKGVDADALGPLFEEWEFGSMARRLLGVRSAVSAAGWRVVDTLDALRPVLVAAREASHVAVDVVLDGDDALADDIAGVTLSWGPTDAVFVPWSDPGGGELLSGSRRAALAALLEDATVTKVTHDAKRLLEACTRAGLDLAGTVEDLMLVDYVTAAHERSHDLLAIGERALSYRGTGFATHAHTDVASRCDPAVMRESYRYAAEGAQVVWLAHGRLMPRLEGSLMTVYRDIELPLVPILAKMEARGIGVDRGRLEETRRDVARDLEMARDAAFEAAGRPFEIDGRKELQALLFEELGLPATKKLKDGYSTDASVLEELSELHPLPAKLLAYRKLQKLLSTYLDALPDAICADGRIHSSFNQAVAATGRLSSNNPNLQNIPVRSVAGRRIREAFVPREGWRFISADYSQIELRVLAHYCGTGPLVTSFRAGDDIHARTAAEVFGVPREAVTAELRSAAKAINFGLIYGMSGFRLARELGVDRRAADRYIDEYFERLPMVRGFLESAKQAARDRGYASTLFGRRRILSEIHSGRYNVRMAAEREATNTPVQGSAADLIKLAMIRVDKALTAMSSPARLLLQVHDELLLEAPEAEADAVAAVVAREMAAAAELAVPLAVNTAIGDNWQEAHG